MFRFRRVSQCEHLLLFFGVSGSLRFKRASVFVFCSEGRKEGVHHLFECELAVAGRSGPPFFSGEPVGRKHPNWFWCVPFVCQLVGLALVTVPCSFLSHELPTQSP